MVAVAQPVAEWSSVDDWPTVADCFAAVASGDAIPRVRFTAGTTYIAPDDGWVIPSGTTVEAYGATFTCTGTLSNHVFRGDTPTPRAPSTTYPLTVDGVEGALKVTVGSSAAAHFSPGDAVHLRDPTYLVGGQQVRRQPNIVSSVSGGDITFVYPLCFPMPTANVCWVGMVEPSHDVLFMGGHFDLSNAPTTSLTGADTQCIHFQHGLRCTVRDVTGEGWPYKIVDMYSAIACRVENITGWDPSVATPGKGYVVSASYPYNFQARALHGRRVRHTMDFTGGFDSSVRDVEQSGETVTFTGAVQLGHGFEAKRLTADGIRASNVSFVVNAGNGTFGADFDIVVRNVTAHSCGDAILVTNGSSAYISDVAIFNSVNRAIVVDANCTAYIDNAYLDGQQTAGASGLLDCANVALVDAKNVIVRNQAAGTPSVRFYGSGDYRLTDADIVQSANSQCVRGSSLSGSLRVRGGSFFLEAAAATQSAFWVDGAATELLFDGVAGAAAIASSSGLRGVFVDGASSHAVKVTGCTFTTFAECIRLEGCDHAVIARNTLRPNYGPGNCIRLAGSGIGTVYVNANTYVPSYLAAYADTQATPATVVT